MTIGVFYIFTLELNFKLNYQSQFALCCTCSFLKSLLVLIQLKSHFQAHSHGHLNHQDSRKNWRLFAHYLKCSAVVETADKLPTLATPGDSNGEQGVFTFPSSIFRSFCVAVQCSACIFNCELHNLWPQRQICRVESVKPKETVCIKV